MEGDDYENIYSGEEFKNLTYTMRMQLSEYEEKIKQLQEENQKMTLEIQEQKMKLDQKDKLLQKSTQAFATLQKEKSITVEENIILKELAGSNNMREAISLFEWRSEDSKDILITDLRREIEDLKLLVEKQEQDSMLQESKKIDDQMEMDKIQKEVLKLDNKRIQDKLDSFQAQMKEKEFFLEVVFSYMGSIDQMGMNNRSSNLKEYIYYLVTQLRSIIDENDLNLKIELAPK